MSKVEMKINATQERIDAAKAKRLEAFIQEIAEAHLMDELKGVEPKRRTEAELQAMWEAREAAFHDSVR